MAERDIRSDDQIRDRSDGRLSEREPAAVAGHRLAHPASAAAEATFLVPPGVRRLRLSGDAALERFGPQARILAPLGS
jgi:hypothetical protein